MKPVLIFTINILIIPVNPVLLPVYYVLQPLFAPYASKEDGPLLHVTPVQPDSSETETNVSKPVPKDITEEAQIIAVKSVMIRVSIVKMTLISVPFALTKSSYIMVNA